MHFTATGSGRLSLASLTVLGAVRGPETRSIPSNSSLFHCTTRIRSETEAKTLHKLII